MFINKDIPARDAKHCGAVGGMHDDVDEDEDEDENVANNDS